MIVESPPQIKNPKVDNSPKENSTHDSSVKASPQIESEAKESSWASNILTKIQDWIHKDLAEFYCKCREQDKTLNW